MTAQILAFPDRRGHRPMPIQPPQDVVTKVKAYCVRLRLNNFDTYSVLRAVEHWQQINLPDAAVSSRAHAMALRLQLSHNPEVTP